MSDSDSVTKADLKAAVDDLSGIIQDFAQHVDDRFTRVEGHLMRHDTEFANLHHEVADLRASHDRLLNTIDGFVGRIDRYESEQAIRDTHFERLVAWARKVSEKTGIPLEDL